MRIIDMRLRPPYRTYLKNIVMYDEKMLEYNHTMRDYMPVSPSAVKKDMDIMIKEMDEANIVYGVAPVRTSSEGDNEDAIRIMNDYPNRFIGIPMVDPVKTDEAIEIVETFCVHGPCKSVIIEPAIYTTKDPWFTEDERLHPFYDYMQTKQIPLLMTFGGRGSITEFYRPNHIDATCKLFPNLKICLEHGGWPFTQEILKACADNKNLYLSPDVWGLSCSIGWEAYNNAINYSLQDKMMFGSAFPGSPLKHAVHDYASRLRSAVLDKFFYTNAARFFGIE